ncbi:MAG: hypothetical protein ABW019_17045 [Chitinophagaceae bacterium]
MKYLLFAFAVSLLTGATCNRISSDTPACIERKIEQIKAEPKWNPAGEVNEYQYDGRRVFLFSANCCDQYHVLYDENCTVVCSPFGGFSGRGDGKCPDFNQKAKHVRLVWRDDR